MVQELRPDALRLVIDSVFANPIYDWAERPAILGWLSRSWQWLVAALQQFQDDNPALFRWFLFALIGVLVVIMLHAAWVMFRTTRAATARAAPSSATSPEMRRTAVWYQDLADRFAGEDRFAEALMAAFQALVLDLDERGMVRYHPSKTPREYVQEHTLVTGDRERLDTLVGSLYRYVFGHEPCGDREYRSWLEAASGGWHAAAV